MAMQFDFGDFVKDNEIHSEVVAVLAEERFDSINSLSVMSEEDISSLKVKGGDKAILRQCVSSLQTRLGKGPLCAVKKDTVSPCKELLNNLLSENDITNDFARLDLDPQVYLRDSKKGEKPLLIPDFVPQGWGGDSEEEIDIGGGAKLKLPVGKKPKLLDISPSQWISANARIMAKLHETSMESQSLRDYMSYTAKVGELACRFAWSSVLQFDNEYRIQQAAMKFRWGSDSQHLATVLLKERQMGGSSGGKGGGRQGTGGSTTSKRGPEGRPICRQFNYGNCNYGAKCNFEHVCLKCQKSHPQKDHSEGPAEKDK